MLLANELAARLRLAADNLQAAAAADPGSVRQLMATVDPAFVIVSLRAPFGVALVHDVAAQRLSDPPAAAAAGVRIKLEKPDKAQQQQEEEDGGGWSDSEASGEATDEAPAPAPAAADKIADKIGPGRPPSYDDLVLRVVEVRLGSRPRLTLADAVALADGEEAARGGARRLSVSTLRKRVKELFFGAPWSRLGAAQHGAELERRLRAFAAAGGAPAASAAGVKGEPGWAAGGGAAAAASLGDQALLQAFTASQESAPRFGSPLLPGQEASAGHGWEVAQWGAPAPAADEPGTVGAPWRLPCGSPHLYL